MMNALRKLFGSRYKQLPQDDFIRRLSVSVIGEGMLHPGNAYLMDWAIQRMPAGGCMLEIGTYGGLSTNLLCYLAKKHRQNHPFFTCDPWVYEGFYDAHGMWTVVPTCCAATTCATSATPTSPRPAC
jgi:hypothetical protein